MNQRTWKAWTGCELRLLKHHYRAGTPVAEIAREYREHHLPRTTLAHDIGIECRALRRALGEALWQSWPRMTIGRIDAARERRQQPEQRKSA